MSGDIRVFVYGTLKEGHGNHRFLEDAEFLGKGSLRGFEMYHLGGFPAIVDSGEDEYVHGELYLVNEKEFAGLDMLEGYPRLYDRKKVKPVNLDEECWVYFMHRIPSDHKIEEGIW